MRIHWLTSFTILAAPLACDRPTALHAPTTVPFIKEAPPRGPRLITSATDTCLLRDVHTATCVGSLALTFGLEARTETLGIGGMGLTALSSDGTINYWHSHSRPENNWIALRGRARQVAHGGTHMCVIDSGRVACWGYNRSAQLGLENAIDSVTPGSDTPFVNLDGTVIGLAAGMFHTCALFEGGAVKCWGSNHEGQLGIQGGSTRGSERGDMGAELPAVTLAEPAIAIASGRTHSCALLASKRVQCWGSNLHGALGGSPNVVDIAPTTFVALGSSKVRVLAAGGHRTCAVLEDNTVKCWGRGDFGALGQGHTRSLGFSQAEMGDALPAVALGSREPIVEIAMSDDHNCVLFESDRVKCWGRNHCGQLGVPGGDRGDDPGEMGESLPFADFGMEGRK